jgi:hypothetical protein
MTPKILYHNGTVQEVQPKNGKKFTYEELTTIVGGYIEIIEPRGKTESLLVLNEDGKLRGLPLNPLATRILVEAGGIPGDVVVGDCLLCLKHQIE